MADSFIQLPADGAGKSVDTRTVPDGNHREVVTVGSPTTAEVAETDLANGLDVDVTRVQGSVAVTNAGLSALAGAIAGTEVQVDIVSGGSAGVQYTEDDAAPANPVGTALAMVRDDALSGQTTADGDIVAARSTDKGELYVKHVDAIPVTAVSLPLPTGAATSALQTQPGVDIGDVTVNNAAGASAVNVQDGGNSLTVDNAALSVVGGGTEAAAQRVTIANDSTGVLSVDDNGGSLTVDGTVAVTGVATSANQATEIASLAAIESDADAIRIATQLIDDPVQVLGTDVYAEATSKGMTIGAVRRDADTTLVGTTNEFGPLQMDANGRLKVEAFSGETLPVSLAAGGTTQYAEDTAHVSGDLVTMAGVVQQTADAAISSDGDRSALQVDASGFLKVNIKAGAGSGGTAMADDAAFTPTTTQGTPAFGLADETSPDSVDEGDAGALRMTLDRKLLTRVVGATDANRLDVDASGHAQVDIAAASVTVPVSAASLPLPTGASTLAEQQTQTTHLATIAGDTTDIEAAVELIDDTVKTLGTDTYTEATTKGLVVGAIRRDADTTLVDTTNEVAPLQVDANGRLKVEAFSGETLPISGTVTANAGTNLNTSALALEAGGNLAAAAASLSVLDDWDESDRAKVNPIAGQAGVQGASGTVTALTQRVVLATDVGLPAGTANIGDVDIASVAAGTVMEVVGDVASDAAVPANPVVIGARASTAQPTAVSADGDSVNLWANRKGAPIVSMAPHVGILSDPWALTGETAQYTTTQTSTVLVAGGGSERLVVTKVQIQAGGTTAGTMQLYFGTGAYSRGTNLAIFDGEFAPSATLKPGVVMDGPFISAANGDDLLVTTSAAINPLTITVWFYVIT